MHDNDKHTRMYISILLFSLLAAFTPPLSATINKASSTPLHLDYSLPILPIEDMSARSTIKCSIPIVYTHTTALFKDKCTLT